MRHSAPAFATLSGQLRSAVSDPRAIFPALEYPAEFAPALSPGCACASGGRSVKERVAVINAVNKAFARRPQVVMPIVSNESPAARSVVSIVNLSESSSQVGGVTPPDQQPRIQAAGQSNSTAFQHIWDANISEASPAAIAQSANAGNSGGSWSVLGSAVV